MGKNRGTAAKREKVDHRQGKNNIRGGGNEIEDLNVPQELIDKAALLGYQVWEVEEYEGRKQMKEASSDDEEDSDLSEESKAALRKPKAPPVKASQAKANKAAANREMPPSSSDEEEEDEKRLDEVGEKPAGEDAEDDSDEDDEELERMYGMGRNNNKNVKVRMGGVFAPAEKSSDEAESDEEEVKGQAEKVNL